jgi:hypothetical protein
VSVRRDESGCIILEGSCAVEDAEPLLQLLAATPNGPCDWTRCIHIHTAVVQVILMGRPVIAGPCGDSWIEQWVAQHLGPRHV